jgi:hypothetical protein
MTSGKSRRPRLHMSARHRRHATQVCWRCCIRRRVLLAGVNRLSVKFKTHEPQRAKCTQVYNDHPKVPAKPLGHQWHSYMSS